MARPRKFQETEVLDSATEVFWRLGYDGASMAELTKAMAMNAPSIYFAFGSKRGLFDAVLERYDLRRAAHGAAVRTASTALEAAECMLFGAVDWLTDPSEPPGCLLVQSGLATSINNPDIPIELARRRNRVQVMLTERFQRAQHEGDLTLTADPAALARYIQLLFSGLCVEAAAGSSRERLIEDARRGLMSWPGA